MNDPSKKKEKYIFSNITSHSQLDKYLVLLSVHSSSASASSLELPFRKKSSSLRSRSPSSSLPVSVRNPRKYSMLVSVTKLFDDLQP